MGWSITRRITAAALLALAGASVSVAEEVECRTGLGAIAVDNVRVPDGRRCVMQGTRVQGSIVVGSNASLMATRIRVVGNVQAEAARYTQIVSSVVGGSVQLKAGGAASVKGSRITGDLQFEANRGALKAVRNTIGGSLQAVQNGGGLLVVKNGIDGNLQCKENAPRPRGGGNVVGGNAEDQCDDLAGARGGNGNPAPGGLGGDAVPPAPGGMACAYGPVRLGDDVEIPAGVHCVMTGTRIAGSIKLNRGASLDATGIVVDGNVQTQAAAGLVIVGSRVNGSVQAEAGGSVLVRTSRIGGSVQLVGNAGPLTVDATEVGADVQVFGNGAAGITVSGNTINGNLQCKENAWAPVGGANLVGGNREDQCATL
jgi:hypothetical protein